MFAHPKIIDLSGLCNVQLIHWQYASRGIRQYIYFLNRKICITLAGRELGSTSN